MSDNSGDESPDQLDSFQLPTEPATFLLSGSAQASSDKSPSVEQLKNEAKSKAAKLGYGADVIDEVDRITEWNAYSDEDYKLLVKELERAYIAREFPMEDLSNGMENTKIRIQSQDENRPRAFKYITKSFVSEEAPLQMKITASSSCTCKGGTCLTRDEECCACVPKNTWGGICYDENGLLHERCLQTIIGNKERGSEFFIKECNRRCGCSRNCGNKVIQRGVRKKLELFECGKGWGLRTLESLACGEFVIEYVGEILSNNELFERNMTWGKRSDDIEDVEERNEHNEMSFYSVELVGDKATEDEFEDDKLLTLDARLFGNASRFINHRCNDANLIDVKVLIDNTDEKTYFHLAFFTKREVNANEELTWDYGIDFKDDKHPIKAFKCKCGSDKCRDRDDESTSKDESKGSRKRGSRSNWKKARCFVLG